MPHHSALRCVSDIRQNNAKPLISNELRFIVTCLLTGALWGLFHVARHTYATEITISHGVPLETVSRMLGHSRIETTQIYAKVTDDKIDSDTNALNERIAERFSVVI